MTAARSGFLGWVAAPLLSMLLFLSVLHVPLMGSLLNPFAPLPIVYFAYTHGMTFAASAVFAVAGLISIWAGPKAAAFYLLSYGVTALLMARLIKDGRTLSTTVALTAAVALGGTVLLMAAGMQAGPAELYGSIMAEVKRMLAQTIEAYQTAGMPKEQLDLLKDNQELIAHWMVRILPGAAIVIYLAGVFMNYVLYAALRRRWDWLPAAEADLTRWAPPEKMVFAFIAGGALALIPNDAARTIGVNLLIVTNALYFLGGMCVMQFWFDRTKFPRLLRWAVYALVAIQPFLIAGTAGLGLFDLWLDFRKIRPKGDKKENDNASDS